MWKSCVLSLPLPGLNKECKMEILEESSCDVIHALRRGHFSLLLPLNVHAHAISEQRLLNASPLVLSHHQPFIQRALALPLIMSSVT